MRHRHRKVLMIDVGGGSVKLMRSGGRAVRKFETGESLSATQMAARVQSIAKGWRFDVVSMGYPGIVRDGRPVEEPQRVGRGWVGFDYERAFGCPVRIINDASMQALAAYRGKRMLFVGLGTGVGSTLVTDDVLIPIELGSLLFNDKLTLHERLGARGLSRIGRQRWRRDVMKAIHALASAFCPADLVIGGGNAENLSRLPKTWRKWTNAKALLGAERLWGDGKGMYAEPHGSVLLLRRG